MAANEILSTNRLLERLEGNFERLRKSEEGFLYSWAEREHRNGENHSISLSRWRSGYAGRIDVRLGSKYPVLIKNETPIGISYEAYVAEDSAKHSPPDGIELVQFGLMVSKDWGIRAAQRNIALIEDIPVVKEFGILGVNGGLVTVLNKGPQAVFQEDGRADGAQIEVGKEIQYIVGSSENGWRQVASPVSIPWFYSMGSEYQAALHDIAGAEAVQPGVSIFEDKLQGILNDPWGFIEQEDVFNPLNIS